MRFLYYYLIKTIDSLSHWVGCYSTDFSRWLYREAPSALVLHSRDVWFKYFTLPLSGFSLGFLQPRRFDRLTNEGLSVLKVKYPALGLREALESKMSSLKKTRETGFE